MRQELHSIRGLLQDQLSGLAWGELGRRSPQRAALLRRLSGLELKPSLVREIVAKVPTSDDLDAAWARALRLLGQRITVGNDEILSAGGIAALVGPTGVGKTTTVAKLAARFALRHGAEHVALVTTDSFRVGAVEQLRTYGRIMGIPVRVTNGGDELQAALTDLADRRLVLIDTAGMSQRDIRLSQQLAMIRSGSSFVQSYLVLSATTQTLGLEEAVRAFQGVRLDGCIITKLDEATGLGNVLSTVIRQQLPVAYLSEGQRVPEDLRLARAQQLIAKATQAMQTWKLDEDDESLELTYGGMAALGRL
jgi:flagellar biosynthesis protein FlhF